MTAGRSSLTKLPAGRGLGYARSSSITGISPLRIVEVQGRLPNQSTSSGTHNRHASRYGYVLGQNIGSIVLAFDAFFLSTTAETNNGNDFTILECSIESSNGTVVPVTFSGHRTKTLTNGDCHILSDEIPASAFGQLLLRGATCWVKTLVNPGASGKVPSHDGIEVADVTGYQSVWFTAANTTPSSTDAAGVYTATGVAFTNVTNGLRPIMLGRPLIDGDSYIALGDSVGSNYYDFSGNGLGGQGLMQRFAYNYGTNPVAMMNFCRASARMTLFTAGTKWRNYLQHARYCIDQCAINDIADVDLATLQSRTTTLAGIINAGGIIRNYKLQPLCVTTSTDNWTTNANQTVTANWDAGAKAELYDQWCASQVGTLFYARIPTPTIRDPADPYKFRTDGATTKYTAEDGVHPSTYGHACVADDIWFYFNPAFGMKDIGSARLLVDGTDPTTILDSADVAASSGSFNGKIATHTDLSGNARNATQTTNANRPDWSVGTGQINGITVPSYDGVADSMLMPSSTPHFGSTTLISAFVPHSVLTGEHVAANTGTGSARLYLSNQACNFGQTTLARAVPTQDSLIIEAARVNGTGSSRQYLKINSDTELTGTVSRATPNTEYRIGAYGTGSTGYLDMELGFFGYWGRKLTPRGVNEVCAKLATQFGGSWTEAIY